MPRVDDKQRGFIEPLAFGAEVKPWEKAKPSLRWTESTWEPKLPPPLLPGEKVGIDFEYDPNDRDMTKSVPIAYSVWSKERQQGWYVPWGHEGGGNLPKDACVNWLSKEMCDRDAYGLNIKAEVHMMRNLGLQPDRMKFRPHDVAFSAALLNENRLKGFSLEALAEEYLPESERKVKPAEVPPQYFKLAHAGFIAERGISDSMLAMRIHEETQDKILAEALDRVQDLEDRGIHAVVEMERNGALIDRPKLENWIAQCENKVQERQKLLQDKTGIKNFSPDKAAHMEALFKSLGLAKPTYFDEQKKERVESWAKEALKAVKTPEAKVAMEIKHYKSMLSKYFYKYQNAMDSENLIHYGLHQMRSVSDFGLDEEDRFGTTTGRFSCGGGKFAINIQQVMKCEKQIEDWGNEFIIRELFRARNGMIKGASDASQIEFRLFGHYSKSPFVVDSYRRNPWIDFHMLVTQLMNPGVSDKDKLKALRKHMKHNNFGVLYGMGREKLARRLGLACTCPFDWRERKIVQGWNGEDREVNVRYFKDNNCHEPNCKARQANDIMDEYDEKFPEAKGMLEKASRVARERGYVHTLLGRRRRFPEAWSLHKALNAVIQGSAADVFKTKMIELYDNRDFLEIVMEMPVHDEFVYDSTQKWVMPHYVDHKKKETLQHLGVQDLLDTQSFQLNVPLLWESGFGSNWMEANLA